MTKRHMFSYGTSYGTVKVSMFWLCTL